MLYNVGMLAFAERIGPSKICTRNKLLLPLPVSGILMVWKVLLAQTASCPPYSINIKMFCMSGGKEERGRGGGGRRGGGKGGKEGGGRREEEGETGRKTGCLEIHLFLLKA